MNEITRKKILEAKRTFNKTRGLYGAPISPKRHREAKTPGNVGATKTRDIDTGEEGGNGVVE